MERIIRDESNTNYFLAAALLALGILLKGSGILSPLCIGGAFILGIHRLLGGGTLKLDHEGITVQSFGREHKDRWADIDSFGLLTYRYFLIPVRRMVTYRFVPTREISLAEKAARFVNRFDRMLPSSFGMKPAELAALLEEHRQKALAPRPPRFPSFHSRPPAL
jgi:hypothetical protein